MTRTMTKNKLTVDKLTEIAKKFLKEEYNLPLVVPIKFNNRLLRALGRFKYRKNTPVAIEISGQMFDYYTDEEIIDVLKHELIHYACFILNRPHKDGHPLFEYELRKKGVSSTKTYQHRGKVHVYLCAKCKMEVAYRVRRLRKPEKYYSTCCHAKIVYIGTKIVKE